MSKEADIMTPYPFVIFNRNLKLKGAMKIKTNIGISVGAFPVKRDSRASCM